MLKMRKSFPIYIAKINGRENGDSPKILAVGCTQPRKRREYLWFMGERLCMWNE